MRSERPSHISPAQDGVAFREPRQELAGGRRRLRRGDDLACGEADGAKLEHAFGVAATAISGRWEATSPDALHIWS